MKTLGSFYHPMWDHAFLTLVFFFSVRPMRSQNDVWCKWNKLGKDDRQMEEKHQERMFLLFILRISS